MEAISNKNLTHNDKYIYYNVKNTVRDKSAAIFLLCIIIDHNQLIKNIR